MKRITTLLFDLRDPMVGIMRSMGIPTTFAQEWIIWLVQNQFNFHKEKTFFIHRLGCYDYTTFEWYCHQSMEIEPVMANSQDNEGQIELSMLLKHWDPTYRHMDLIFEQLQPEEIDVEWKKFGTILYLSH